MPGVVGLMIGTPSSCASNSYDEKNFWFSSSLDILAMLIPVKETEILSVSQQDR